MKTAPTTATVFGIAALHFSSQAAALDNGLGLVPVRARYLPVTDSCRSFDVRICRNSSGGDLWWYWDLYLLCDTSRTFLQSYPRVSEALSAFIVLSLHIRGPSYDDSL